MNDNQKYGLLLNGDAKLHRQYFREAVKLLGIYVLYRAPKKDKHYTTYAEIDSNFEAPIMVGCMFHDHPDQQTLKKLGWMSELQTESSLIDVDYDLPGLQQGALFIVPSGLDNAQGRVFRIVKMVNSIVYPSCITCEIVPEYIDSFNDEVTYKVDPPKLNILDEEIDGVYLR